MSDSAVTVVTLAAFAVFGVWLWDYIEKAEVQISLERAQNVQLTERLVSALEQIAENGKVKQ